MKRRWTTLAMAAMFTLAGAGAASAEPAPAAPAAPARDAGPLVDSTGLSFTDSQRITSQYHLYAAGLDWSQPVGLLIYTDGTGEYGLNNPRSTYLLAGKDGMVAVAKRANMLLVTPRAPGAGCACWYQTSAGISPAAKARWSYELVRHVQKQYPALDRARVGFGGYSSGAQWATRYFGPQYAAQVMTDGVAVAISYGGQPAGKPGFTDEFKRNVPFVWNVGSNDPSLNASAGVRAGYDWYSRNGFVTELDVLAGVGHGRSGKFGAIVEDALQDHLGAGSKVPGQPGEATSPEPGDLEPVDPVADESSELDGRRWGWSPEQSRHEHPRAHHWHRIR